MFLLYDFNLEKFIYLKLMECGIFPGKEIKKLGISDKIVYNLELFIFIQEGFFNKGIITRKQRYQINNLYQLVHEISIIYIIELIKQDGYMREISILYIFQFGKK